MGGWEGVWEEDWCGKEGWDGKKRRGSEQKNEDL